MVTGSSIQCLQLGLLSHVMMGHGLGRIDLLNKTPGDDITEYLLENI